MLKQNRMKIKRKKVATKDTAVEPSMSKMMRSKTAEKIKKKAVEKELVKHPPAMTTIGSRNLIIDAKNVCVKNVKNKGRGVFTTRAISKGDIVERCPVLLFKARDKKVTEVLNYYYYYWNDKEVAFCLGYGALYNHSYAANAIAKENIKKGTYDIIALRNIKKDEEVCIDYTYGSDKKVWFDLPPA